MPENHQIKGLIFDCYHTLIDIQTDEGDFYTYDSVSKWLQYQGVVIDPLALKEEYRGRARDVVESSEEPYPEIRIEDIFGSICRDYAIWDTDYKELGMKTSIVFRSASLRKLNAYPQSLMLLERHRDLPKCIVSNGQRVFSEKELKFLGLYKYFDHIIFSSDLRYKKPDKRLFEKALGLMGLEAYEVMSIGDTPENDMVPPLEMGMQAMHIHDAWKKVTDAEDEDDEA